MRQWLWERFSALAYAGTLVVVRLIMLASSRLEVLHANRVPLEGRLVIVGNHINNIDPVLVCAVTPRRLTAMAKRELFEMPLIGWTLWAFGAFPVRRYSADLGALRAGRNHLRAERAVLVFPEGTRSKTQALQPGLPGSAMLALLGEAPIVPVAISGTEALDGPRALLRWLLGRRAKVLVEFGEPFSLAGGSPTADRAEAGTDLMMRRIAEMLPDRYRGAYGAGSEGSIVVVRQQRDPRPG